MTHSSRIWHVALTVLLVAMAGTMSAGVVRSDAVLNGSSHMGSAASGEIAQGAQHTLRPGTQADNGEATNYTVAGGQLQRDIVNDAFLTADYAYLATDAGLDKIRRRDHVRVDWITRPGGFTSVVLYGGQLYLGTADAGLYRWDEGALAGTNQGANGSYEAVYTTATSPRPGAQHGPRCQCGDDCRQGLRGRGHRPGRHPDQRDRRHGRRLPLEFGHGVPGPTWCSHPRARCTSISRVDRRQFGLHALAFYDDVQSWPGSEGELGPSTSPSATSPRAPSGIVYNWPTQTLGALTAVPASPRTSRSTTWS